MFYKNHIHTIRDHPTRLIPPETILTRRFHRGLFCWRAPHYPGLLESNLLEVNPEEVELKEGKPEESNSEKGNPEEGGG